MVSANQIEHGIANYLDAELMNQFAGSGLEKVIAGTVVSLALRRSGAIVDAYKDHPVVKMLGVIDNKGNIDVDAVSEELKKNMPKEGVKIVVPIIGTLTFHKDDIDKLYNYIME